MVTFDRELCVLYKQELDRIMPPEASDIVMTIWQSDPAEWRQKYHRSKDDEARLLDRYLDPSDPLKILVVSSKLLRGFDAPILQAMYIDKPMNERHLLEAVRQTDRPYPNKTHGLIVDYFGILDGALRSLNFDGAFLRRAFANVDELKRDLPARVPVNADRIDLHSLAVDGELLATILVKSEPEKLREIEIKFRARLHLHKNNPVFIALGRQLEDLKDHHRQELMSSFEYLKHLLDLARMCEKAEREVDPREEREQTRIDLTELFNDVRGNDDPKKVERVVNDIDSGVRFIRFRGWQQTLDGEYEVIRTLRTTLRKHRLHHEKELFYRVYDYVKQYY
ncbi:MAG TPA: hypothetical protein VER76_06265 [Pyrinomonadaceae bacterium]|nr:hypothetical protein [Pyrinomonadaceae bacterium]